MNVSAKKRARCPATPPRLGWECHAYHQTQLLRIVREKDSSCTNRQFSGHRESRRKFSSPYNQALKVSSPSQPLKTHAGRLGANMLSPVTMNLREAKVRKQKVVAALSRQEEEKKENRKPCFKIICFK